MLCWKHHPSLVWTIHVNCREKEKLRLVTITLFLFSFARQKPGSSQKYRPAKQGCAFNATRNRKLRTSRPQQLSRVQTSSSSSSIPAFLTLKLWLCLWPDTLQQYWKLPQLPPRSMEMHWWLIHSGDLFNDHHPRSLSFVQIGDEP